MQNPAPKAVIFDLDQTLLDRSKSLDSFVRWQTEGMLRESVSDPDRFVSRFIELDADGRVWKDKVYEQLVVEFDIEDWSPSELLAAYELCFCGFSVPRDGIYSAVEEISKQYQLGLISNGMSPFQERNFRALGFSQLFESVIVSESCGLRKPDRQIFELSCSELGVQPSEAVYVGDNPTADIEGANAAGLSSIFVPTDRFQDCPLASATCSDLGQLPRVIETLSNSL